MKHFDKILRKHFRMIKLAFQMVCIEIGSLVGLVCAAPSQSRMSYLMSYYDYLINNK